MLCVFIQFVKTDTRHKNLTIALNKKHTSTKLLSFRVLKITFIKKNVEHSQTEKVKKNGINKFKK